MPQSQVKKPRIAVGDVVEVEWDDAPNSIVLVVRRGQFTYDAFELEDRTLGRFGPDQFVRKIVGHAALRRLVESVAPLKTTGVAKKAGRTGHGGGISTPASRAAGRAARAAK